MTRATLTVVEDARGVVRYPLRGHPLDLLPAERNIIARSEDAVVFLEGRTISQRLAVHIHDDAWVVGASGTGALLDGRELSVGEEARLADGSLLGWPGLILRFDRVKERPLARVQRRGALLLFDCGGAAAPGRWPCLARPNGARAPDADAEVRVARGLVVAGPAVHGALPGDGDTPADVEAAWSEGLDRERHLGDLGHLMPRRHATFEVAGLRYRHFDAVAGVPLTSLCRRGRGLEPALAVRLAARVARWLVETHAPLALGTGSFALSWDGDLEVLPPLAPRPTDTDGRGVIVELFVTLFPETGDFFHEGDAGSRAARAIWHRLVDPYLGAFGTRAPEAADLVEAAAAAAALEDVARDLPAVSREEIANVVRGLFPDEWRIEQELREELALLDARAIDELWAR